MGRKKRRERLCECVVGQSKKKEGKEGVCVCTGDR
jgi:hypothetical protein